MYWQFTVPVQVRFATDKLGLDIWYNKLCIRDASQGTEELKTRILGN